MNIYISKLDTSIPDGMPFPPVHSYTAWGFSMLNIARKLNRRCSFYLGAYSPLRNPLASKGFKSTEVTVARSVSSPNHSTLVLHYARWLQMESAESNTVLEAPSPMKVKTSTKPSVIWSSGSDESSFLFGTSVVESPNSAPSAELPEAPILDDEGDVQEYVSTALETLERRLEVVLDSISEELTSEVIRERQHLLLMQEKVDMQGQALQREFTELNKKMKQETTIRSMVQQKYREQNDALGADLQTISRQLTEVKDAINKLETPWVYRALNNVMSMFHQCSGSCQYEKLLQSGEDV